MKNPDKNLLNFKILLILTSFALVSCIVFSCLFQIVTNAVNASAATGEEIFLPEKAEEYYAIGSPINAYSDADITAITESDKLIIFTETKTTVKDGLTSLKQVSRVQDYIYYTDNASLYKLPVADVDSTAVAVTDSSSSPVNGTFFGANNEYLVTVYSANVQVYKFVGDTVEKINTVNVQLDSPVAVNSTAVFYVSGNKIRREEFSNMEDFSNPGLTTEYNEVQPDYMIADDDFLYYIKDNDIHRLSLKDATTVKLTFSGDGDYDLGNVHIPKGLAFKNGNLLITDLNGTGGSVQEFSINGETLEFTGYAIASELSAFNRIAKTATNIERYGNYTAVLDGYKLTVIDETNCAGYNKDGFINKFVGNAPDRFALGSGTILYADGETVYIADTANDDADNKKAIAELPAVMPDDISYQSGVYYHIYLGTNSTVIQIDEKTGEKIGDPIILEGVTANVVAADVFKKVYVASNTCVYVYDPAERTVSEIPVSGVKKLSTDLAGNLFALADGKIQRYSENDGWITALQSEYGNIKTFGMNFDRSRIYYIIENDERVFYSEDSENIGNVALETVVQRTNAEFTAATETKTPLQVYVANDGANVYSVSKDGDGFIFNGIIEKSAEYPLIANITVGELTMRALASENGVVLINGKELTEKTVEFAAAPEKAYVTTPVYAYAIPVIDVTEIVDNEPVKYATFAINGAEGKIRLSKGETISPSSVFTVLGKTFYEAKITLNGTETDCYIPADFTVEMLSADFVFENYTVEKLKAATLYENADLTGEILQIPDGSTVKLLSETDGALKVAVSVNGGEIVGFVPKNRLDVTPNTTVRNVLIILAVFGSLAGTFSYFLLRKKNR